MSWVFGVIGDRSDSDIQVFKAIHSDPIYLLQTEKMYVAAGGLKETCLCSFASDDMTDQSVGWIVCGIGIKYESEQFLLMSSNDWKHTLSVESPDLQRLNGHFVGIKWNKCHVIGFNDQLGLRELYFTKTDRFTVFSTRLDWLPKINRNCKIDFEEFGSCWLMYNQLSNKSILTNTYRLASGGTAVCTSRSIEIQNNLWEPSFALSLPDSNILSVLEKFLFVPMNTNHDFSFSLSGGLDSRVILSCLLSGNYGNWGLHSVGDPNHPDVSIAKRISSDLNVDHVFFNEPIPDADAIVSSLHEYIGQTVVNDPASNFFQLHAYSSLYKQNKFVVDGAFGEIIRRKLYSRLSLLGKKALLSKDVKNISSHISLNRADIFNADVLHIMQKGVEDNICILLDQMPSVNKLGVENWLDLLAITNRLPNCLSNEQSRLDSEVLCFMPFAQPSFLKCIFDIPVDERKNGKISKEIIHQNYPNLAKYPLVKGLTTHPYILNPISAWLWANVKKKLGYCYKDLQQVFYLEKLSEYVQDIANSKNVKDFEYYDYPKIINIVEKFYSGNKEYAGKLDWWLTFEIWRQTVYGE